MTNLQKWLKSFSCESCPAKDECKAYDKTVKHIDKCFKTFVDWAIKEADDVKGETD